MDKTALSMLSGLASSPLARIGFKYWWILLPAAGAIWLKVQKRRKKADFEWIDALDDVALVAMITVPLIQLSECATQPPVGGLAGQPSAPVSFAGNPVKDAVFTPKPAGTPIPTATAVA